ncbi:MAG: hypothetical protein U0703_28445 [Anaerolineae bacterium]
MIQPLARLVLVLLALFAGALAALHAQPYDDTDLRAFLDSGCAAPCFAGIQPGVTDIAAAQMILRDHPWVGGLRFSRGMALDSGMMSWSWSGAQPDFIDPTVDGKLWLQAGRVEWVEVATRFAFGDLWLLRTPQSGRISPQSVEPRQVSHLVDYDRLEARSQVLCPLLPDGFWRARLVFRVLGAQPPESVGYQLPRWRGCP